MKAQLSYRYFDVVVFEFNGQRFTAELKGGSSCSREEYSAIASEIVRRVNAYDQSLAALRAAYGELRCHTWAMIGRQGDCESCAACLAKLEVLTAIEAVEKGEGNAN